MDPSITTAIIAVASIIAIIAAYGIHSVGVGRKRRDEMEMQKFKDSLEPNHREKMAQLAAQRDAEITKYTHQKPTKQIEGSAN